MPELMFKPETHQYFVNEEEYDSVTKIIDYFLPMNGSIPKHILEFAAWRGECVHHMIHLYEENNLAEGYDKLLQPYLDNWIEFRKEQDIKNLSYLIDIKTGAPRANHKIQLAAYYYLVIGQDFIHGFEKRVHCEEEKFAGTVDYINFKKEPKERNLCIVYLKDKLKVEFLKGEELIYYKNIFFAMLETYKFKKKIDEL